MGTKGKQILVVITSLLASRLQWCCISTGHSLGTVSHVTFYREHQ